MVENNINTPKKKTPIVIAIVLIALTIITAIIVALIFINRPNEPTEEPISDDPIIVAPDDTLKYKDESRLKQASYTIDDINKGFSYASISFTGTKDITIRQVINQNRYSLGGEFGLYVYFNHNGNKIPVHIEFVNSQGAHETVESINQACKEDQSCSSDYLEGAKTLLVAKDIEWVFYSSTKSGQFFSYSIGYGPKGIDKHDNETARSILAKVAMTISDDNGSPYIEDMATRLKYPGGKHVKDYALIDEVGEDYVRLNYHGDATRKDVHISIIQTPINGVSTTSVSANPKVESFKYEDDDFRYSSAENQTYFRIYDGDNSLDVCAYTTNDGGDAINNYDDLRKYLDAI